MQKVNIIQLMQFLDMIFGSEERQAISVECDLEKNKYFAMFNADEDPITILHLQQAMWLFYSLNGEPAEYWRKIGITILGRIPYELTDDEADTLSHKYFEGH